MRRPIVVAKYAEIVAGLLSGQSIAAVHIRTGVSYSSVRNFAKALIAQSVPISIRAPTRADPQKRAQIVELINANDLSNRAIAKVVGCSLDVVNKVRLKQRAQQLANGGEVPTCGCGRVLHHPYGCRYRRARDQIAAGNQCVAALSAEEQGSIRTQLLAGTPLPRIAQLHNFPKQKIQTFLNGLSDEDKAVRKAAVLTRNARKRAMRLADAVPKPVSTNPLNDPLYSEIARYVSHRIDPALRDDMIMEAYVEVMEGKLDRSALRDGMRSIRRRVFNGFANRWGHLSLDEVQEGRSGAWVDNMPESAGLYV